MGMTRLFISNLNNKKKVNNMAMLTPQSESSNGFQIDELAPAGDYVATCIDS